MIKTICIIIIIICTCAICISEICLHRAMKTFNNKKARIEKDLEKDRERFNK